MTLEEMIKAEQASAAQQQPQQAQQTVTQTTQTVQITQQVQQQDQAQTINTLASSDDPNVNREEFSLKTNKTFEPAVVPEDFYTVKLIGLDKKEAKAFDSNEMVPNFIWKFEVISDSAGVQLDKKVIISKWCKAYSKGENSNNYKFYEALMQKTPEDGYNILDALNKYARAYISQYTRVDTKTGLKITKSVIEKLLPLKK